MTTELELHVQQGGPSRHDLIWGVFEDLGGMATIADIREQCLEEGVFSPEHKRTLLHRGLDSEIRRVLKERDASGLCRSGPTEPLEEAETGPVWKQRVLWDFADYAFNIRGLIEQRDECWGEAIKLADECRDRFGDAPTVDAPEDRRS